MSATIDPGAFVELHGRLCPADLARGIASEVHERVGRHLTCVRIALSDSGMPLSELQEAAIVADASWRFDGIEQYATTMIVEAIESASRRSGPVAS